MKSMKKTKHPLIWAILMGLIMVLGLFCSAVFAQDTATVRLSYVASGVEFKIYRVGDIGRNNAVSLTDSFSQYAVDLNNSEAAATLAGYASRDNISPKAVAKTDSSNAVTFSGLEKGVYLITGESYTSGTRTYTASPVIVSVVGEDIDITGKYEFSDAKKPGGGGGGWTPVNVTTEVSALKVWSGSSIRQDVTVQLLCDGEVYAEAVLNASCNWRTTWNNLDADSSWTVVEKEPVENFDVSIEKDGSVFIINNIYNPTTPSGETTTEVTTEAASETTTETSAEPPVETTTWNYGVPDEPDVIPDKPSTTGSDNPDNPGGGDNPGGDSGDNPGEPGGSNEEYLEGGANPYNKPPNPKFNTNNPDENGSNPSGKKGKPDRNGRYLGEPGYEGEGLPQTGQLWWPVPVMSCSGMFLIIIGMGLRRKES